MLTDFLEYEPKEIIKDSECFIIPREFSQRAENPDYTGAHNVKDREDHRELLTSIGAKPEQLQKHSPKHNYPSSYQLIQIKLV